MAVENVFINLAASSLASARVVSSTSNVEAAFKNFVVQDVRDLNLLFVDGAGSYVDLDASSVRAGIGGINKRPDSGTWVFTHGGNDVTFDFDESASSMESALDASPYSLAVAVTSTTTGVWVVKFDSTGSQTLPTFDTAGLVPDSSAVATKLVTGDGSTKEEWMIRLYQDPWVYQATWANITSPGKGKTASLSFDTENLYKAFGDLNQAQGFFEVELTDASANVSTVIQAPVLIVGQVNP